MNTQVVDTDGHIFERDEIMFEYLEPPYRGHKEVFLYPFFLRVFLLSFMVLSYESQKIYLIRIWILYLQKPRAKFTF